jgi:hypothetical protein
MHEIEGHGGHAGHGDNPLVIPVSITMSVLAVLLAAVTLLGHRAHTEQLLLEGQATNQWAYYQAKNGRMNQDQIFADLLAVAAVADKEKGAALRAKYLKEVERYASDKDEISEKANELEKELNLYRKRADHFDAGEGILEFGLIICSLTLLTNKKLFWFSGVVIGAAGVIVALSGFLVRL